MTKKPILFLGYGKEETSLISTILNKGRSIVQTDKKHSWTDEYDLIVSFGYRHIISKEQIANSKAPMINLHISYLPWNRGAHPNFWSHYENTPSGVTIHEIDNGIDTGNIIYQRCVVFKEWENTFTSTNKRLINEIEYLFIENIDAILEKRWKSKKQHKNGTSHKVRDLPASFRGWNSNIKEEVNRLKYITRNK